MRRIKDFSMRKGGCKAMELYSRLCFMVLIIFRCF